MDLAVGVGRPVVQHERRAPGAWRTDLVVQAHLVPALEHLRLALGEIRLHREGGLGQVQGALVVAHGVSSFIKLCQTSSSCARRSHIPGDLRPQLIEGREPALVANARNELHGHMGTVDLAREIEQMNLQQVARITRHRRPGTDIGHPWQGRRIDARHADREDPAQRAHPPVQVHVQGRKPDAAPALVAVGHPPANRVGPPEATLGVGQVATPQRLAYAGGADALAVHCQGLHGVDGKAVLAPRLRATRSMSPVRPLPKRKSSPT